MSESVSLTDKDKVLRRPAKLRVFYLIIMAAFFVIGSYDLFNHTKYFYDKDSSLLNVKEGLIRQT